MAEDFSQLLGSLLVSAVPNGAAALVGVWAGPLAPIAAPAARQLTSATLGEFLSAQEEQMLRVEQLASEMRDRLGVVAADVELLLYAPIVQARSYLEEARHASSKRERDDLLVKARDQLFAAHAQANTPTKRMLAAQYAAGVFLLQGLPTAPESGSAAPM